MITDTFGSATLVIVGSRKVKGGRRALGYTAASRPATAGERLSLQASLSALKPAQMLGLFGRTPAARFPDGRVGYAVGDVHGRLDLLRAICEQLEDRAQSDTRDGVIPMVVFLGDYVDRGPHSAGVLSWLASGRPDGFERRFLKGNHEQSMLAFLDNPVANPAWLLHGGVETLVSYGVAPPPPLGAAEADLIAAAASLRAGLPAEHSAFLAALERYMVLGDYLFVHAGIDPDKPLDAQTDADLFWSRERFLASKRRFSHRIVHGHTPSDRPFADARRVGLDTGAYASGTLAGARFEGEQLEFFSVSDPRAHAPAGMQVEF